MLDDRESSGFDLKELSSDILASLASESSNPGRLELDPENVEQDLTRLILCLVEFIRQLMEVQAVRRMEAGSLTPEEEERLGSTLMKAKERVIDVAASFGLTERDLRLDLGPLGRLI